MIKQILKCLSRRVSVIDGKLSLTYASAYTYGTERKAELHITHHYKTVILGFENCVFGARKQFIEGVRLNSYCLMGFHVSFLDAYDSVIETVEGRILNGADRSLIKRKVFA